MERRSFQTPVGELWLWGRPEAFDSAEPYVMCLGGLHTDPEAFWPLARIFAKTHFLFGLIPGDQCPRLVGQSVGLYATAYSAAIKQMGRQVILCGLSLGATTALGVRARPLVRAILALEPLMSTGQAWPLVNSLHHLPNVDPDFLWSVFGISQTAHEGRNYFPVLDGQERPVHVLLSAEPLGEPRDTARMPSLVPEDDRALLASFPNLKIDVVTGAGHRLGHGGSEKIITALQTLIQEHMPVADLADLSFLRPTPPARS
jgi:hypothetical protein